MVEVCADLLQCDGEDPDSADGRRMTDIVRTANEVSHLRPGLLMCGSRNAPTGWPTIRTGLDTPQSPKVTSEHPICRLNGNDIVAVTDVAALPSHMSVPFVSAERCGTSSARCSRESVRAFSCA